MSASSYRTTPEPTTQMPSGIPYIIGNEAAERFSYYGMRTVLFPFMTKFLVDSAGEAAVMPEHQATAWAHTFYSAVYFFPIFGALIADTILGKYLTIVLLSLVYCAGHAALAIDETQTGLLIGLTLIAVGAGGIKPCVSAHVGDQFGRQNQHLLPKVFGWFYFAINFGAAYSTLITPAILNRQGVFADLIPADIRTPPFAFGLPGLLMLAATIIFWLGRKRYAHIPPSGAGFVKEIFTRDGLGVVLRLGLLYLFVAFFWCLYDQTSTSWVAQAEKLDRRSPMLSLLLRVCSLGLVNPGEVVSAEQVQFVNPLFIMLLIPIFDYVVYPTINRFYRLTPLRKVGVGMLLTVAAFGMVYGLACRLDAGETVSVWWQIFAFLVITAGEIMVSITVLEYSYTQAPPAMKSFVMSLNLFSVSLGNLIAAGVNSLISWPAIAGLLKGPNYFLFFAALLASTTTVYMVVSQFFQERTYVQGDDAT